MLCWFITVFLFLYGCFIRIWIPKFLPYGDTPWFWIPIGLLLHFLYPIPLEILHSLYGCCTAGKYFNNHNHDSYKDKSGIIYTPDYNITFFGLENCHPFDSQKYGRCFNFLNEHRVLSQTSRIHEPDIVPRALLSPCTWPFLLTHCYSVFVCWYLEMPLLFLPADIMRYRVLIPMMKATMGTIEGCCIALEKGWAINLSGGYHHARRTFGSGFCIYPDISLAIDHMRRWHPQIKKVMIVDLDAHQGNGHERDYMDDKSVYILDGYNHNIWPGDEYAKQRINYDLSAEPGDGTDGYLAKLDNALKQAFNDFSEVDFVIYNAGTDILEGDPLGELKVSVEGIIKRDEKVFRAAFDKKVPILMVLSGGYQKINAKVIADSIKNLTEQFPQMNKRIEK